MKTYTTLIHRMLIGLTLGGGMTVMSMPSHADDSYQYKILFKPTQGQLLAESRGRVMIYDGLSTGVIERAFETQFDRIEHMMFVNVREEQQEDDEADADADGC